MNSSSDLPLNQQFARAIALFNCTSDAWPALGHLANLASPHNTAEEVTQSTTADSDTQAADSAIAALCECQSTVSVASVLSANEQLDEIATAHVKYIVIPFVTASAHAQWQGEPHLRLQHLESASAYLTAFFTSVDTLGLLPAADREHVLGDSADGDARPVGAASREEKIRRYKADKETERRLSTLFERVRHVDVHEVGRGATHTSDEHGADDDEEVVRDASLLLLESAIRRAVDLHASLLREMELLRWAQRQRARGVDPREKAERARPRGPPPSVVPGMPPSFRVVNERERERAAVFRPSHSLPTYTVEEWGEIEAQRLAEAESENQSKEVAAKRKKEEEDSDDDEAVNLETMEKRRWDNWKDEHNRGSGNTIR